MDNFKKSSSIFNTYLWKKSKILKLHFFGIFYLLMISSFLPTIFACPNQVLGYCTCTEQLDGVLLNCTTANLIQTNDQQQPGIAAIQLMEVLKASQAQLGLLKSLVIRRTNIPVLPSNFFAGLYIKRLELIDCEINVVEKGAFMGLETVLGELVLSNNLLTQIPISALDGLRSLFKLDLSNNAIGELKAEDSLPSLPKLFDINLSHNKIAGVHKSFFENAKASLQTINLGHNQLTEVPASALRGFRLLMALHLHSNELTMLSKLSFMNLPVLGLLNLASNKIQHIHRQAFLNAPNLRYIYLPENRITEIQPFQFSQFEQLEMLDLSNNRVKLLNNDSFSNLLSLKQLYLGENQIGEIAPYAFTNASIQVLILESNQMHEIKKETFQGLKQLQQLSLKENKISSIDPNAFYNNPSLVMVDLSRNKIIDLAPATFLSQLNLLLVDLSYNKMVRTPFGAFNRRVATVLLQENPLVCVEKIHMLQQGNGVYIPNNDDHVCGLQTQIPVTEANQIVHPDGIANFQIKKQPDQQTTVEPILGESTIEAPRLGEEVSSEEQEQSAFVQQQPTVGTDIMSTNDPEEALRSHSKLPNIKLIKELQNRVLSTAQINQFIDQTQMTSTPAINEEQTLYTNENSKTKLPLSAANTSTTEETIFSTNEMPVRKITEVNELAPIPLSEHMAQSTISAEFEELTTGRMSEKSRIKEDFDPISNNPNVIYPHPVPFLANPPKMHTSHNVKSDEQIVKTETLPPSIVIAEPPPLTQPAETIAQNVEINKLIENDKDEKLVSDGQNTIVEQPKLVESNKEKVVRTEQTGDHQTEEPKPKPQDIKIEQFELDENRNGGDPSALAKEVFESSVVDLDQRHDSQLQHHKSYLPTAVIVICMSTVAVVMSAVFVGMCVARRRQIRLLGSGSDFLSATPTTISPNPNTIYMASAAAQHHHHHPSTIYGGSVNGTLPRSVGVHPSQRLPSLQDDIYGWYSQYSPGTYNAYAK